MFEEDNAQWGLVHALVLDGKGGARSIARTELDDLQLHPQESLWLHWDRSHPQTRTWLLRDSGLSEFACELLLEENTRPRLLPLVDEPVPLPPARAGDTVVPVYVSEAMVDLHGARPGRCLAPSRRAAPPGARHALQLLRAEGRALGHLELQSLGQFMDPFLRLHPQTDVDQHLGEQLQQGDFAAATALTLGAVQADPAQHHTPFPLTDVQQAYWIGR